MTKVILVLILFGCTACLLAADAPNGRRMIRRPVIMSQVGRRAASHSGARLTGTSGVEWGPIVQISPDVVFPHDGNYSPQLVTQGDTVHCIWAHGNYRLPYTRSTDNGASWETPLDLLGDSTVSKSVGGWPHMLVNDSLLEVEVGTNDGSGSGSIVLFQSSDRGSTWLPPLRTTIERSAAVFSAASRADTTAIIYCPADYLSSPLIGRSTDGGVTWSRAPLVVPSSSSNQERALLTPGGILNVFHPGDNWPGPAPEIVLSRSRQLGDTWDDVYALSPVDGNGSDMPEVASYDELNGCIFRTTIGVMWRGEDWGGAIFSAGMALRLSYDGGQSWKPFRLVSDIPFGSFHSFSIRRNLIAASWSYELGDFGPFHVKTRLSFDGGNSWDGVTDLTPDAANAGIPSIALSDSFVHVAWEQNTSHGFNIFYCRGRLLFPNARVSLLSGTLSCDTAGAGVAGLTPLVVSNPGLDTLRITCSLSDNPAFSLASTPTVIPPGQIETLAVRFVPPGPGMFSGVLQFMSNSQTYSTDCLNVTGVGVWHREAVRTPYRGGAGKWAMVSAPLRPGGPGAGETFPALFGYRNHKYVLCDSMVLGGGYWAKPRDSVMEYTGAAECEKLKLSVNAGWNLIGGISVPVAVSSIRAIPYDLIVSNFFTYGDSSGFGRYLVADTLFPGRSYWVKAGRDADLIIANIPSDIVYYSLQGPLKIARDDGDMPPPPPSDDEAGTSAPPRPLSYRLSQNFPNPFNPTTRIAYELPSPAHVTVIIYDVLGRQVSVLVDTWREVGVYDLAWDASALPTGIYYCRMIAGGHTEVRKVIYVR